MKNIQDNGKIKLCETDNMDHLVRLTQTLNENNIPYETRLKKATEYYGAAEPPVRCGESHLSGLTEPPHFVY